MSIEIEFNFRTQRFTDAAAGLRAFSTSLTDVWDGEVHVLTKELQDFLKSVTDALASRHGNAWPSGTTGQTLSSRSGALVAAIQNSVRVTGTTFDAVEGQVGAPGIPYGAIQEFGGTIKPKKGKYLAIPLPAALNANGTPKVPAGPRGWSNTFCKRSKAGNLIIFQKRGTTIIPLYVLKDQVTLPPRLGMGKTLQAGLPYFVERTMDQMVKDVLAKVEADMANKKSVRLQILERMVQTFRDCNEETPVGDPYGISFGIVSFGPVDEADQKKRFAIGVHPGAEQAQYQYPFVQISLTVNVEFRATINRDDPAPGMVVEEVLTVVKRLISDNKQWGGLAYDTKIIGTETDLMSHTGRSAMGVCICQVLFRHTESDPRTTSPDFG